MSCQETLRSSGRAIIAAGEDAMIQVLQAAMLLVFPALVILAGLRDMVSYTIPNWISLALLGAFPVAALALGLPIGAIGVHLGIGVAALIAGMAMFALGWIGGGDAKLFAAAGLWLGWPAVATFVVVTGLAGGGLALALLTLRSPLLRPITIMGPAWFARLGEPGENVPYGLAIAIGGLAAFPASALMKSIALPF
jgi:prepilin peptidase CpaA